MNKQSDAIRYIDDVEMLTVSGSGIIRWLKKAYKWVKEHVTGSSTSIGVKGKF